MGPFAQARDAARQEAEEEHADSNLRKTGFHPVWYSTVWDYAKNYLVSVYFLTQSMMKPDTSVHKKLMFSQIKGRLPLTPPPC